ncbi:MAG: sorbitol dehydrogenase [Opitutaceae bacterium]|nr:sorbitol dehydrogenase [Opitutaceae bacterium]|tara:strand:- start:235 stop:1278 length:1044 start_codon:yes stop_codon:yes gene_type:complete
MKAIVVTKPGALEITDIPIPKPDPYQALVKNDRACICNLTDSELLGGHFPGMEEAFPFALGHESTGIVQEVGAKVKNFKPGDRTVGGLVFDLGVDGLETGWGGFCEYTLANDHDAMLADGAANEEHGWVEVYEIQTQVDLDISADQAVLLCTWREVVGAFRDFNLQPGDNVLIFGGGPVGLSFVKFGKLFGLGWIGLVDRHKEKQDKALEFGVDAVFTPGDPAIDDMEKFRGKKLDVVIDAVGKPEIVNEAMPLVRRGGSFCIYGFLSGMPLHLDQGNADFNFNLYLHQWPTRQYEKEAQRPICDWLRSGQLSSEEFITHRFSIDEIDKAFTAVRGRKVIKAVLEYS